MSELPPGPWPHRPLGAVLADAAPAPDEVRLWCFALDAPALPCDTLHGLLDAGERTRGSRFVFERDRRRFIAAHGLMRVLLGACVGAPPAALRYETLPLGKPRLAPPHDRLHFNLSHSGGWALLGVCTRAELGVDIEASREVPEWREIARTNFAPPECARCEALPVAAQLEAFHATWVRKEAFVKACGQGLSMPLDGFEVTLEEAPRSALHALDGEVAAAAGWTLLGWRLGPQLNAAAALAATNLTFRAAFVTT